MLVTLWAVLALLAAVGSLALTVGATTRAGAARAAVRAIDAEPGRPGLRDGDLATRLAGLARPDTVTVTAGSRHGTARLLVTGAAALLTLGALVIGSGLTAVLATVSLAVSVYVAARFANARRLHADGTRLRLRRWRTHVDIPLSAVRGVGFVPARQPGGFGRGRVWIALWCDPRVVSGLPESLTETATVGTESGWVRLDAIESVSTAQLTRLWRFFAERWTIGDEDGVAHAEPSGAGDPFGTAERLRFDAASGYYTVKGDSAAHVVHRAPTRWRSWRTRITRDAAALPHTFEVRDRGLRTRWVISKPDAAWKTAFYVTDRWGTRVGTLRATSVDSRNFDLCGTDNRVLATLRPGEPQTTVVDTNGNAITVWNTETGELYSVAARELRPLCLLAPIVARFAGTAASGRATEDSDTLPLAARPAEPGVVDATMPVGVPREQAGPVGSGAVGRPAEPSAADATTPVGVPRDQAGRAGSAVPGAVDVTMPVGMPVDQLGHVVPVTPPADATNATRPLHSSDVTAPASEHPPAPPAVGAQSPASQPTQPGSPGAPPMGSPAAESSVSGSPALESRLAESSPAEPSPRLPGVESRSPELQPFEPDLPAPPSSGARPSGSPSSEASLVEPFEPEPRPGLPLGGAQPWDTSTAELPATESRSSEPPPLGLRSPGSSAAEPSLEPPAVESSAAESSVSGSPALESRFSESPPAEPPPRLPGGGSRSGESDSDGAVPLETPPTVPQRPATGTPNDNPPARSSDPDTQPD